MSELVNGSLSVFVVVEVWRGMVADAKVFRARSEAQAQYDQLRKRYNLDEDDLEIIETVVH